MKTNDPINTLHRYFIWADRMRVFFLKTLKDKDKYSSKKYFDIDSRLYMSLWYGLLYVVIEGWMDLKLKDKEIDKLIKDKNTELLKRYRNGVFHFQKKYNDDRFENFFKEDSTVEWLKNLREEFSRWFLEYYKNNNGTTS